MVGWKLPENATVEDVLSTLRDAEEYLRGMVGNMATCDKEHGSAVVRIGMLGKGRVPNYRVEPSESFSSAFRKTLLSDAEDDLDRYFVAYNGRNHKRYDWKLHGENWSGRSMSYEEIRDLLGEQRAKRRQT